MTRLPWPPADPAVVITRVGERTVIASLDPATPTGHSPLRRHLATEQARTGEGGSRPGQTPKHAPP